VCRVWWKRGERPPGLCDKRFTFAYIFAAVEPGTDNAFALVLPSVGTEAMQAFLDDFAKTIGPDEHVVMVLDQAGWHGAIALRVPDCITLTPLPPYSPELNPVEWVWEYMKERFLSLRLLNDYDAIAEAVCKAWNRLLAEAGASPRSAPTIGCVVRPVVENLLRDGHLPFRVPDCDVSIGTGRHPGRCAHSEPFWPAHRPRSLVLCRSSPKSMKAKRVGASTARA
jgi:transposase